MFNTVQHVSLESSLKSSDQHWHFVPMKFNMKLNFIVWWVSSGHTCHFLSVTQVWVCSLDTLQSHLCWWQFCSLTGSLRLSKVSRQSLNDVKPQDTNKCWWKAPVHHVVVHTCIEVLTLWPPDFILQKLHLTSGVAEVTWRSASWSLRGPKKQSELLISESVWWNNDSCFYIKAFNCIRLYSNWSLFSCLADVWVHFYLLYYDIMVLWLRWFSICGTQGNSDVLKSSTIQTNCLWSCDLQSAVLGSDKRFGQSLSWRPALRTHCLTGALQFGLLFTSSPSRDCPLWHHMPAEWAVMDRSLKSVAVMTLTTLTAQLPLQKVTEGSLCEPIRDQSNSTGSDVWVELSQQTFSAANELMLTHK